MVQPYIGEIRCFGFNFAPVGWATCSGQLLAIAENNALFAILGTTYGGDGRYRCIGAPGVDSRPSLENLKAHLR
jgi:microcystin-dependent protein